VGAFRSYLQQRWITPTAGAVGADLTGRGAGGRIDRPNLLALDTGCAWGGALSSACIDGGQRQWVQVACEQAQTPG